MKLKIALLLFIYIQIVFSQKVEIDYLFTNVSIVPMNEEIIITNKNIAIKDGIIVDLNDSDINKFQIKNTIDLKGKYIIPSLADAHVHLPKDERDIEKFLILNLINGVTKLRSMRGDWKHIEWRNKYNTESSIYPKLLLSPPPISRNYDLTTTQIENFVDTTKEKGFDFIKILSIKNEELFIKIDSLCKIANIPIGGHFPNNISDSIIFKSNYTSLEHLGGLTGQPDLLENRLKEIKKNNIFICPTLSWYSIGSGRYSYEELRDQPGIKHIPKTVVDDWIKKTKQYREKLGDNAYREEVENELKKLDEKYQVIKKLKDLGVNMLLSPDSSSKYMIAGFGVVGEMELLKNADLSNFDILKMATVNFAIFFKKENYGTIQVGKDADFLILNNNPLEDINTLRDIESIFFNNNYLDKQQLEDLSNKILPN